MALYRDSIKAHHRKPIHCLLLAYGLLRLVRGAHTYVRAESSWPDIVGSPDDGSERFAPFRQRLFEFDQVRGAVDVGKRIPELVSRLAESWPIFL